MLLAMLAEAPTKANAADKVFPPFDPTFMPSQVFWLIVYFTILYFALSRWIIPRLRDTLEKRANRVASDIDEAARLNEQATEAQQALELKLADARASARETAEKAHQKIEAEIEEKTSKVDAEIVTKIAKAEASISEMRSKALANVEAIAVDAAEAVMSQFDVAVGSDALKSAVQSAVSDQGVSS